VRLVKKEKYGEGYNTHVFKLYFDNEQQFVGVGTERYVWPTGVRVDRSTATKIAAAFYGKPEYEYYDGFERFKKMMETEKLVKVEKM